MIRCDNCKQIFDSDEDPDCFVEVGNMRRLTETKVYCVQCRDRLHELEMEAMSREPPQ